MYSVEFWLLVVQAWFLRLDSHFVIVSCTKTHSHHSYMKGSNVPAKARKKKTNDVGLKFFQKWVSVQVLWRKNAFGKFIWSHNYTQCVLVRNRECKSNFVLFIKKKLHRAHLRLCFHCGHWPCAVSSVTYRNHEWKNSREELLLDSEWEADFSESSRNHCKFSTYCT